MPQPIRIRDLRSAQHLQLFSLAQWKYSVTVLHRGVSGQQKPRSG